MKITFIGHACFMVEYKDAVALFDPFFVDEEKAFSRYPKLNQADYIFASHGHDDHIGNIFSVAGSSATVVGMVELCSYLREKGISRTIGMNFGGTVRLTEEIDVTLVKAEHSSSYDGIYLGEPAGFVVRFGTEKIYFSGDTAIFSDMKLINDFYHPTIGIFCAGGHFTADKDAVAYACNHFFTFNKVIPMHYNTFPPIRTDMSDFASKLTHTQAILLQPFETVEL